MDGNTLKKTKSETLMQILFLYGKGLRSDEFDVDPAARWSNILLHLVAPKRPNMVFMEFRANQKLGVEWPSN